MLSVAHAVGVRDLTWGMWTQVLGPLREYVHAYPGYDFQFDIRMEQEESLQGRVIGAGFLYMRAPQRQGG